MKRILPGSRTAMLACLAGLWTAGHGGRIIHPWNSASAILKSGGSLDILFQAEGGETVKTVELRGPYNRMTAQLADVRTGSWVYDKMSGNSCNTRITATVPLQAPEELYDLVVTTTAGATISRSSVKVVREYRRDFTFVQFSDTHLGRSKKDDYPAELEKITKLIGVINIVSPDFVFVTGDLVDATANVVGLFPDDAKRWNFFYQGYPSKGLRGIKDIRSPVFSVPGNHDWEESVVPSSNCQRKADFWNRYNGIQSHHFQYGDARFLMTNNGFIGCSAREAINGHNEWLKAVGPGKLRVLAKHIYGHTPEEMEFTKLNDIRMGLAGHNHNIGPESPYRQGPTDMYISNWIHHMTFSVFNVDSNMNVQYLHNKVAVENPDDDPGRFQPRLALDFTGSNDGSSTQNTATISNQLDIGFPRIRVRFVMRKGAYAVWNGKIDQIIQNDSVTVVDVLAGVTAKGSTQIRIYPSQVSPVRSLFQDRLRIKTEVSPERLRVRFPIRSPSLVTASLHDIGGGLVYHTRPSRHEAGDHHLDIRNADLARATGGVRFLKLEILETGRRDPIAKTVRVWMP